MTSAHLNQIEAHPDVKLGIISPDGRDSMLEHAQQFKRLGIPFVFDPGQGLPMFDGTELAQFVEQATWVTVNDYEGKMLCERTGWSAQDISRRVKGLIITMGHEGSQVWVDGQMTHVPPVQAVEVVDPTGCGDAYRGGLLYGLEKGWPLVRCAELGNRMGSHKIAHRGPQNYVVNPNAWGL
jgi:adenosine kinase